jgi:hypothetical protein
MTVSKITANKTKIIAHKASITNFVKKIADNVKTIG